ncbi:MAG: HlyD family secretion protein [Phenylobacterium sp.]|jgi:HlyD family secretion protein
MIEDTSGQDAPIEKKTSLSGIPQNVLIGVLSLFCLILIVSYAYPALDRWSSSSLTIDAKRLSTSMVYRGQFIRDISVQGQIVATNRPMLFSPANGRATLNVRAGDKVKSGDILARIESPDLLNEYAQEQATLFRLETELSRQKIDTEMTQLSLDAELSLAKLDMVAAKRSLNRAEIGIKNQIIAMQDFELATDEKNKATAVYQHKVKAHTLNSKRLNLELDILNHSLDRQKLVVSELDRKITELDITSPVDGVVGNLEIDQKSVVTRDKAIMSVVDMSLFEIKSMVPEIYANELLLGMAVEIDYSGQKYHGKLAAISPEISGGQVSAHIRFTEIKPENLRQNQRVTTRIIFDSRENVLMVARGPFMQSGDRGFAYVIEDGVAIKKSVQFGISSVGRVEVISGVVEGDEVVISSSDVFQDHERILLNNQS